MNGHNWPPLRSALTGAGLVLGFAASAQAQVIEIGPAGITTLNGPAVVTADGASPIVAPRAPTKSEARQNAAAPLIERAGGQVELSPRLLEAIAYVESRFNQHAVSPAGAIGVMQLMPATAAELGVDPHNPEGNIRGGADYLRKMVTMFGNNVELAVAAYNAGPSAVIRHGGVPPYKETRAYVAAVMDYLARTSLPETE
ncbi:MAG: lytic transglycosylase domain-containing protein [Hyphomonadaceae bacterium]|nr:lytic transglycosylase domain-containing protein [Hyphomonadaceae bacterium]